ncbi:hypothetical protein ACF1DV_33855 [Streptomyces achromogenes]|uniref:hypothetical protein n=1 Tax=Streptomyces achromogenes TaxID=67255 RepID=UPI0036F86B5B
MEWMETMRSLAEDPLVRLAVGEGVRGVARRVRRGRGSAAAHSEAGPATTAGADGMETAVTMVADGITGEQFAAELLQGVGSEYMRAATRLLGPTVTATGCGASPTTGNLRRWPGGR